MSSNPRQSLQAKKSYERWIVPGVCLLLAALVWGGFGQERGFEFVNYDDADNVSGNPDILAGLSWHGMAWAFTHSQVGRWAPLVTISHMADCQFYGFEAGGHHLTNVILHAAAAIFLFLAIWEMSGALWRGAFVAAVFAIHPLRAETVGWVSARGEVMAGLFYMLALLAYARHARRPGSHGWYWCVAIFFAMGLMCKPTIVMLPFVLLLLDCWPLGRFAKLEGEGRLAGIPRRLIAEKIPLFALSLASCAVAVLAQQFATVPGEKLPLSARAGNAVISYAVYAWQMVCPAGLAVFYPHPKEGLPAWQVIAALLFLGTVSAAVYAGRRRFPYALAGWCWYLVMLLPVCGIIETGAQAHADRYTYLPQIGLYLVVTWGVADLASKWESRREILGVAAAVVITLLAWRAHDQVSTWRDSVTLWKNAVASTGPNSIAQNNLGSALLLKSRPDEALLHLRKALEIDPGLVDAYVSMGNALLQKALPDEAIAQFRRALEIQPGFVKAHTNLGMALQQTGHLDEAIAQYRQALALNPDIVQANSNLGEALRVTGQLGDAITHLQKAVEIDPYFPPAHNNLGLALQQAGRLDEAIAQFQRALTLNPGYESARDNLAQVLRQKGQAGSGN